jgi:hypothetical protein
MILGFTQNLILSIKLKTLKNGKRGCLPDNVAVSLHSGNERPAAIRSIFSTIQPLNGR